MAESDAGPRATGTVSTEEAERLSERFRPSWEDDPAEPPLSSAITRPLPVVAVTAGTKATVPQLPVPDTAQREPPQPTLIGIAPEPPPSTSAEELDWEAPPKETPSSAAQTQRLQAVPLPVVTPAGTPESSAAEPEISVQIDIEELPPPSKPSGIGEKYVPKEEGAPPVVLNEDVKAAEIGAQAALEAQHRARRAPTILRMKAADVPVPAAPVEEEKEEEVPFAPRRSGGAGKLVVLGLVVTAVAAASVIFLRSGANPDAAPAPTTTTPTTVAADTAAPPPPVAEPARPAPEPTSAAPEVPEAPAPVRSASTKEARTSAAKASTGAAKPAPASKAAPPPKTGPVAAKPAPRTGVPKTGGKAAIVRDAPF